MAFCAQCGSKMDDNAKFCPSCGAASSAGQQAQQPAGQQEQQYAQGQAQQQYQQTQQGPGKAEQAFQNFTNTPDETGAYSQQDIDQNKVLALFAYLGILIVVPLTKLKESPFCKFHVNQGLTLLLAAVAWGVVASILGTIFWAISWALGSIMSAIFGLVWLAYVVFIILGIVNAAQGKAKELPLIGKIKLIK